MAINVMGSAGPNVLAQQVYGAPADMQMPFMQSQVPQLGLRALMEDQMAAPASGLDWQKLMQYMYNSKLAKPYDYGGPPGAAPMAPKVGDAPKARAANLLPPQATRPNVLPTMASLMGNF